MKKKIWLTLVHINLSKSFITHKKSISNFVVAYEFIVQEVDEGHYCHSSRKSLCRALLVMLGHCNLYTWITKKEKKRIYNYNMSVITIKRTKKHVK
jgi:hypothetical protein